MKTLFKMVTFHTEKYLCILATYGPWASPSPVIACMTDVAPCGCLAAKFDSCNGLLSSVHTLLVNILPCVRLYIKQKYYIIIIR